MSAKQIEVALRFGIDPALTMPEPGSLPAPELFPKRLGWVVRKEKGARVFDLLTWASRRRPGPASVTNLRNLASPFWRSALMNPVRRSNLPVTEFFEWSGKKGAKTEHRFSLNASPIFAYAGLGLPTEQGKAYAILTCEPNPIVANIHRKARPVILHPEGCDRW